MFPENAFTDDDVLGFGDNMKSIPRYIIYREQKELGIKRGWPIDERHSIRHSSAPYWKKLKARLFTRHNIHSVGKIPGIKTSLQSLYDQGYSQSDISAFFGISRERGRQWFRDFGIKKNPNRHGSQVRIWSDELNHFTVVPRKEFDEMMLKRQQKKILARRLNRTHKYAMRMNGDVDTIRHMVKKFGFVPYKTEFLGYVGCDTTDEYAKMNMIIGTRWGARVTNCTKRPLCYYDGTPRTFSHKEAWDDLYKTAGFTRPDGRGSRRRIKGTRSDWYERGSGRRIT